MKIMKHFSSWLGAIRLASQWWIMRLSPFCEAVAAHLAFSLQWHDAVNVMSHEYHALIALRCSG